MRTINKHESRFKDAKFVLTARAKNGFKPVFQRACVKDGKMYCTDSKRVHFSEGFTDIENGVYEVRTTKDEIVLTPADEIFPDIEKVLPKDLKFIGAASYDKHNTAIGYSRAAALIAKNISGYVNADFIREALIDSFDIFVSGDKSPIVLKNCTKTAVIMPCVME